MLSCKRVGIISPGKVVYRKPSAKNDKEHIDQDGMDTGLTTTDASKLTTDTGLTTTDTGLTPD